MQANHVCALALLFTLAAPARGQSPVLISSDPAGVPGAGDSWNPDSSFDGRWVAFSTDASNLSPNGLSQILLKDLGTWGLEYVSLSSGGAFANGPCSWPSVSWDARYVAFESDATNLVAGDTNASRDVFVRDRWTATTTREGLGQGGVQPNASTQGPQLSFDGRYLLFLSVATNLVPGITSGHQQHYLRDRWTGQVVAVAVSTAGVPANGPSYALGGGVSSDGRYVVFSSDATNLVAGDTNGVEDVFLRDTASGTTKRLSVTPGGVQGNDRSTLAYLSDDGRYAAFATRATNLVVPDLNGDLDVLVHEIATGKLERVSVSTSGQQANAGSFPGGLSWNGRYVIFGSNATNLFSETASDWDAFVRDRTTGVTELVSPPAPSNSILVESALSPNGRFALLNTGQTWAPNHPSATWQIYATDRGPVCITPATYCTGKTNSLGCAPWVATYGCSSATETSGFLLFGGNVRNNKQGLLFYGFNGQSATPFQGGTMCVAAPRKRTPIRDSGGNAAPANDCSGLWTIDMNEYAAGLGGGSPSGALLVPGTVVDCQWWGRDPGASFNTALTGAIEYVVGL